jgi:F-type H+-transporting ATPase subunit gamma
MESLEQVKSRLKAVKNVGQITKAMEVVAATKMRRAQETALNSRPYAFEALGLLEKISHNTPLETSLTKRRPVK